MIVFKTIRYKNFLSTGNVFTKIDLRKAPTTLIIGNNGSGKSTLCDALSFALYGKPYRNINKPQLVNSITKKECLVEVEFDIGAKSYLVRRGIAPAIFQIYVNDELIPEMDETLEYQEFLTKHILKLVHKSFCQIIILGSTNFVPFMQLTAAHRREIIEDLLDIQVFSTMNALLKDRITTNKDEVVRNEYDIKLLEQKKELLEKNTAMIQQNSADLIEIKNQQIDEYQKNNLVLLTEIDLLEEDIKENTGVFDTHATITKNLTALLNAEKTAEKSMSGFKKQKKFYEDHQFCPTCSQIINDKFREDMIGDYLTKIADTDDTLTKIEEQIVVHKEKEKVNQSSIYQIEGWQKQIKDKKAAVKANDLMIEAAQKEIEALKTAVPVIDNSEINDIEGQLGATVKHKYTIAEQKRIYDIAALLLKDSGIKAKLIKQYVPVINKMANKYLASLDYFINFELDEKFNETIKSRHRDEFSYASFSEGEKMRIDFALLFTWRAVAKLRNSVSTNLLILDEVFDSSLDATGVDEFLKMLNEIAKDANIFVISHKGDTMFDKFSNTIKFEKKKNFSKIV